jgi:AraC-like DNA-binding protein
MSIVNLVYYSRNTKMRAKLNSGEGDLIRKICSFVERTEAIVNSSYIRTNDDATDAKENMLSKEFLEVMMKVIPYVSQHKNGRLTMHRLSMVGGMDVAQFYDVMTTHLYRNPRFMARYILLQRAGELLRTTDMTVEEIAHECRFSSPNYFMGNFFHEYKMTPSEYRREHQE